MAISVSSSSSRPYVTTGDDPNALMVTQFSALAKRLEAMAPTAQTETLKTIETRSTRLANDLRTYLAQPATGRQQMLERMANGQPAIDDTDSADTQPGDAVATLRAQGLKMLDDMRQQDSSAMLEMLARTNAQQPSFWQTDSAAAADPFASLGGEAGPEAGQSADALAAQAQGAEAGPESSANAWWTSAATSAYTSNLSPKDAFLSGL